MFHLRDSTITMLISAAGNTRHKEVTLKRHARTYTQNGLQPLIRSYESLHPHPTALENHNHLAFQRSHHTRRAVLRQSAPAFYLARVMSEARRTTTPTPSLISSNPSPPAKHEFSPTTGRALCRECFGEWGFHGAIVAGEIHHNSPWEVKS